MVKYLKRLYILVLHKPVCKGEKLYIHRCFFIFISKPEGHFILFMSVTHISALFQKYKEHRPVPFTEEQFTSFLVFFPALMMAASDGIVDREEWSYCQKLAFGLVASFQEEGGKTGFNEELKRQYRREFIYLLSRMEDWEEDFLQAVEEYFLQYPYAKKFVSQTIFLFADASNGICEDEENTMEYLFMRLKLDREDFRPFGLLL